MLLETSRSLSQMGCRLFLFFCVALGIEGCHRKEAISNVGAIDWQALQEKRIFFGHQSVGENILSGIGDLLAVTPGATLRIVKTRDPEVLKEPILAHADIGRNENPISKCDDFSALMRTGVGEKIDIAFFKFCFVDIQHLTDWEAVFSYYKQALEQMEREYPKTTFVHVTVPLTTVPSGPKVWIKRALGRLDGWHADNAVRARYNERIRQEYAGRKPLFDLAQIESTLPDGSRCLFSYKGTSCECLAYPYTSDGGHLNETGRMIVARHFLYFLGSLSKSRQTSDTSSP
ncbi:MAG: hypothetical protein ABIN58_00030 [candidate division WOR-3 bacterium]